MMNCYIDPIFLATESSITPKHYSEVIFPVFFGLFDTIEKLETKVGDKFIAFNITENFVMNCMSYNPYKNESNEYKCRMFKEFIFPKVRKYRNINCNIILESSNLNEEYKYQNENVPDSIMNDWNTFLNSCSTCSSCKNKNLELLSYKDYSSKNCEGYQDFFNNIYFNLIEWLNQKFEEEYSFLILSTTKVRSELKVKGPFESHHPSPYVNKIINKINDIGCFKGIRRVGKSPINKTRIANYDDKSIEINISFKDGADIFILETEPEGRKQVEQIIDLIKKQIPEFNS